MKTFKQFLVKEGYRNGKHDLSPEQSAKYRVTHLKVVGNETK
jgi:hypothetical protein